MSEAIFLSVRGIRKSFGPVKVLHGVDLDLPSGSVTALLGENGAGKSTLVRILAGDHHPDNGSIVIDGSPVAFRTVAQSRGAGIRLIAQEIADAPTLTVAENIALGSLPNRMGFVDFRAMRDMAQGALDALGADLPLDAPVSKLRLGERQIVEIARATVGASRCLIFDEPTAALSDAETKRLFSLIERMRERGATILYITHRLDEVFAIADRVCVLRDGRVSMDAKVDEVDQPAVVAAMVGRPVAAHQDHHAYVDSGASKLVAVKGLTSDSFSNVDVDVAPGEIVGLYGKVGSGVPELAGAIFGAVPYTGGKVEVAGENVSFRHPGEAIARGIGFLPADRASEGLLRTRTVAENLSAPSWRRLARGLFISRAAESRAFTQWHKDLKVRSRPDGSEKILTLSGGNQQKVLLGRWLEAGSRLLLLVEPTRGVDVGARQEIYHVLRDLARQGHGILIASSDYEDITEAATRAVVMVRGRVVAHLPQEEISTARLTEAAGGGVNA
ncbi:sugar ABC transporter ATP-binding protein [Devosia nitrariae]|uniref:Sugar ABC transporter ATP-binding protein n=1 Tax=Devosia nitrariae TaxID=2071872 RepID=A0ABQ5W921_9HYPH|nr:sugar ABC transporter ATP-binding protein [Devosia nitrariae]GLQ56213.1 sugar ABC transporter ATP-binding protein [Devosia nitrariae]